MKVTGYTTAICLATVGVLECTNAAPAPKPVYMTSQIQRLLNEKQEKISKLEECDGKRKGFMIAGISTLGLTAVGVGVNIAQASKSNKLSNQIADQNLELEKQQNNLANINSQISEKQNDQARRDCESDPKKIYVNGQCLDRERYECDQNPDKEWKDGRCVDKEKPQPQAPQDYSGYILDCSHTKFDFVAGTDFQAVLQKLNNQCRTETGSEMVKVLQEDGKIVYECKGMSALDKCAESNGGGGKVPYDGIIGNPCTSNGDGSVWTNGGDKKCLPSEGSTNTVPCSCKKPADVPMEPVTPPAPVVTPDPTPVTPNPVVIPEPKPVTPPKPEDLPDRIIDKPCKKGDLAANATAGKYVLNGSLKCLKAEGSTDIVNCQCSITQCDTSKGYSLKDGRCVQNQNGGVTTETCQASGGRGLDATGKCMCDWTNNGNNQHLRRGSNGLCECQNGYKRVDPNNLKLGCVAVGLSKDLQDYKKLLEQFDKKYSAIDTAVDTVKRSMEAIEKAARLADVKKYGYKTALDTGMSTTRTRVNEANSLYNQAVAKYNGLSDTDKTTAGKDRSLKDKAALDAFKREVDQYLKTAEGYAQRGQKAYDKLVTDEENDAAGAMSIVDKQNMDRCINSHGQWDGKKCSCARDRGLELSYGECECINIKWEWCPKKNACRPSTDC